MTATRARHGSLCSTTSFRRKSESTRQAAPSSKIPPVFPPSDIMGGLCTESLKGKTRSDLGMHR